MPISKTAPKFFLGAQIPNTKVLSSKVDQVITKVNELAVMRVPNAVNAINVTATATPAQIIGGAITSTSAAAVSITLPTATQLATALGVTTRGTSFDFLVDNSAGANTVTLIVGTGITVTTPAITGGATLTVSTANAVGWFRLVFTSLTTAKILRIA